MDTYLLKFTVCLFVFWLVYFRLLERQKNHNFKRFYLIGIVLVSAIIPLLTITQYVDPVVSTNDIATAVIPFKPILTAAPIELQEPFNWVNLLWTLYVIGIVLFGLRFIANLMKLYRTINKHEQLTIGSFMYVLLDHYRTPHSFFRYIFLNKDKYNTNNIPKEVLIHEESHARQWHSLDIIIIELLQIIFWFHPLIYILKHHIKLNHEFLADFAVINQGIATQNYQHILLQFSSSTSNHKLTSAINYSSIKKRFTVMKTETSKTRIWLSTLLLLPIIAVLFYSFAEKEYVKKETTDIVNPTKETLENHNTHYDLSAEDQKILKTILTVSINQKEDLFINGELGDLKSLEKVLQNLRIPQNYTINVEGEKQSSPEMMKDVLTLIKKYDLLLNSSQIQLPKTEQNTSYNPTFLEYIMEMEEWGATFFIDGKNISAEQAKSIAKNNNGKRTEMLTQKDAHGNIIVKLSSQQNPPTAKEVAEYNAWAKKLKKETLAAQDNERNGRKANYPIVKQKDLVRYVGIYKRMTPTQKQNSAELPLADDELKTTGLKFPPPPPPQQNPPTAKEIAEYNAWAKTINDQMAKAKNKSSHGKWSAYPIVKQKDVEKFKYIYGIMKESQKNKSEAWPSFPPPPPPPPPAPPKDPSFLTYITEMEKHGASFYYNQEKITAAKAKSIAEGNKGKGMDMITQKDENGKYVVKLSKQVTD